MRASHVTILALAIVAAGLAGCVQVGPVTPTATTDAPGGSTYAVPAPDPDLPLLHESALVPVPTGDVEVHARIVRPATEGPVPVIVQFTPYTAPGRAMAIEPQVAEPGGRYVAEFAKRGFAYVHADVRGTGDSGGCLDLRGQLDIEDAWHLTEWLGTREWSNGKVGFIGASYPGSEAHIAAIADNPHLGGVIPVVASTSFYHYHHKAGVPYLNHLTTNSAYTAFATAPTVNPQYDNWAARQAREAAECDQDRHLTEQLDQTGAYDPWWVDRNLRWRVDDVRVPVLMAQGLADWNVKPDHIATWYNDLDGPKTLIAGQWGHQYPEDAPDAYGEWWALAAAFFDETLRGADTGLFREDVAYVQGTDGEWRAYAGAWPPTNATWLQVNLTRHGLSLQDAPSGEVSWLARPESGAAWTVPDAEQVVLALPALDAPLHVSGTPRLDLTITPTAERVHLVAVLEVRESPDAQWRRENYGYLNPVYREGLDSPLRVVPGEATPVTVEFYPQEDVIPAGAEVRLVLRSVDPYRAVPAFDAGAVTATLDGERPGVLHLPLSPLAE